MLLAFGVITIQSQNPRCDLPGQDEFIFVPIRQAQTPTICEGNSLQSVTIPNTVQNVACAYSSNGKLRRVLIRKHSRKYYTQWQFCQDVQVRKFDGFICQFENTCYLRSDIVQRIQTEHEFTGETCHQLIKKLQQVDPSAYNTMFRSSDSQPCDFKTLIDAETTTTGTVVQSPNHHGFSIPTRQMAVQTTTK
uniref:Uncharacterized protein n=1 Tax=Romanomermis culicivorax TaxID=13658 RepID=A0A915KT90_ROMCU